MRESGNNIIDTDNTPVGSLDVNNTALSDELSPDNIKGSSYSKNHTGKAVKTITLISATALTAGGLLGSGLLNQTPSIRNDYRFIVDSSSLSYDFQLKVPSGFSSSLFLEVRRDSVSIEKIPLDQKSFRYQSGKNGYSKIDGLESQKRYYVSVFYIEKSKSVDVLGFPFFTLKEGKTGIVYDKDVVSYVKKGNQVGISNE